MTTVSDPTAAPDTDGARALKIVERMPGHAWAADAAGQFTYISPQTLAFLGTARESINAPDQEDEFGWRAVVHPDDYERVAAKWRYCLRTGEHYDTEHRLRRADGVYRWFRNSGRPSRDAAGNIVAWYGTTIDIEDLKQVEAELRARQRELSHLVAMVPSHVWRLTPDGEPVFFNKRMVDFIGLDVEDTDRPGKSRLDVVIEAVHPDDAATFRDALCHCLATGEAFALRYRLRRADGVYHWMSSRAEPMRDESGRIVEWYGICHDIDDQMRAEQALRRRERELSLLVDMVPSLLWRLDADGEPIFFNRRAIDFLGLDASAFNRPGMSRLETVLTAIVHPDDIAAVRESFYRCLATGARFFMRYRLRRVDNVYRWMSGRAEPLQDEHGRIVQWYGLTYDIDDQVHAEEALRRSEHELQQMIDAVPVRIWSAAPNGGTIYFNKRYQDYLRSAMPDFDKLAQPRIEYFARELIHPDDAPNVLRTLEESFNNGTAAVMRFRRRERDGDYRWSEFRIEPRREQDGTIAQWYGVSLDIDDEVRAQEALQQASDKLAKATQAASLAELSASIAHEVNQPLAAIVANSHACQRWLESEPPNLERVRTTVERIIKNANSAAAVVSRIRALFRQTIHARSRSSLDSLITEVRGLLTHAAVKERAVIEMHMDGNLPLVAFDRVQIQQVLINLMRNGLEAMQTSAEPRTLRVGARRDGEDVRVEISDSGPGIENPDKVFDAFFTTKESGMGMGLAISRSIVESHGGRLWIEGDKGRGATFVFTLPIEPSGTT